MKISLQDSKTRNGISIIIATICFALITLLYFNPILQGKRIKQHDIDMSRGMSQEIIDYRESTGEQTLWTNSAFGGMPSWNISVKQQGNLTEPIYKAITLGFPHPISSVFICMLGFFILLLVLDVNIWLSFAGALAYGLTSYLFIVIGAGHNAKAMAMAFMAPVIAGILLTYKGKYLWGSILTAFAVAFQARTGHLQITYYLLLIVICIVVAEFISDLRQKKISNFFKASGALAIAAIIGTMTFSTILYANYEFGKETTRGKPVLTQNNGNQTQGLDRDYITQWSYGIGETWSLLIPNAKGGASAYIGNTNPALDKVDRQFRSSIAQSNAYWGDQPGTSGPVYVGAIIVFLFVLGCFTVKGKLKWALLAATILSILLSWGKNFMGFTNFFLDFVPGYDKFRAVSMTLVIAEVCMPLLGILGLAELTKNTDDFKKNARYLYLSLGITAGFCLLFFLAPKVFFNFLSQGEAQQFGEMISGRDGAVYQMFASQLEDVRVAIFKKDAIRSFLFIILSAIPIILFMKGKMKSAPAFLMLSALILLDMIPVDQRYLNNQNFIDKRQYEKPFTASVADKAILEDPEADFRVINLTKDVFNDASTSYFHKSIGGYSGAKLRRYQDVISRYLSSEVARFSTIFKNAQSNQDIYNGLAQQKVLNMLNTKYIIYDPNSQPLANPCALGNAWTVSNINWVENANEEIDAIEATDLRSTAIINKEFEGQISSYLPNDSVKGEIALTEYLPNRLTYQFESAEDKLVVFSEIWTKDGWKLYVDGSEQPLFRANYLLRAAMIPSGSHELVMRYDIKAYHTGNTIALISSLVLLIAFIGALAFTFMRKKETEA